ncbi:hypothetical protein EOD39_5891 [Acipenser ruthenus]|uniref:DUF4371 domain-containing protein n=1 Tax=Acipenser ruthenus TaxID=7906 RepID=A0A444UCP8_ACIRT|nr:hypothetical protein EOD39_5891 [Acipenser ruthenus]
MSSGRTKATSITESVLAPKSQEFLLKDWDGAQLFSVGSDGSNKGNKKFFLLTMHYFSATEGIKHGLHDFYNDNDETIEAIATRISNILQENGLSINNVSSYVADNASVNFGKHRWLSLLPAIERVLHSWTALRAYYLSEGEEECGKIVWEAFSEEELESFPLWYVYFLHNLMGMFHDAVKKLECTNVSCTELQGVMEGHSSKLKRRREDKFYGRSAQVILGNASPSDNRKFREETVKTLTWCIEYLDKWYDLET